MPRYYAGIGSRETPPDVLANMTRIAARLEKEGYILRSGAADGADTAFEAGVVDPSNKQIFLPHFNFNGSKSPYYVTPEEAYTIAAKYHPGWNYLYESGKKLHARNVQQVLGKELNEPAEFVICWTPDGADGTNKKTSGKTGGTGQAIRIAAAYGIRVINLYKPEPEQPTLLDHF